MKKIKQGEKAGRRGLLNMEVRAGFNATWAKALNNEKGPAMRMFAEAIFQTEEIANRKALRQKKLGLFREQHKGQCRCLAGWGRRVMDRREAGKVLSREVMWEFCFERVTLALCGECSVRRQVQEREDLLGGSAVTILTYVWDIKAKLKISEEVWEL